MKTVEYSGIGIAFADCLAEHAAQRFLEGYDDHIVVSTSNFIDAVRVCVAEGKIDHKEVQFKFNGEIIPIKANGSLVDWPKGFCDTIMNLQCRALQARIKARKSNGEQ